MTANIIDFDAFRKERNNEDSTTFRIGGKDYALPASLPASLALDVMALADTEDPEAEVGGEMLEVITKGLLGVHYDAIIRENGVTLEELPELIKMVFAAYNGGATTPPNRAARRAKPKALQPV